MFTTSLYPKAKLAAVLRPRRKRVSFEPLLIVGLEDAGHQLRDGVVAKIRGQIGDADSPMCRVRLARQRRRIRHATILDINFSACALQSRRIAVCKKGVGRVYPRAQLHAITNGCGDLVVLAPIATLQLCVEQYAERVVEILARCPKRCEYRSGFIEEAQPDERHDLSLSGREVAGLIGHQQCKARERGTRPAGLQKLKAEMQQDRRGTG